MLQQFPEQVAAMGSFGTFYFVCFFMLTQCLIVVPVTPILISAAYIFEAPLSYQVASLGVMGSAVAGFFLSRFVLRPQVQRMFSGSPVFRKISAAVEREGFKIAMLCRSSLVLPSPVLTFVFGGMTTVGFADFFAATVLASVPEACAIVYLAGSARNAVGTAGAESAPWYFYVVTLVTVSGLLRVISGIAKRALDESIEEEAGGAGSAEDGSRAGRLSSSAARSRPPGRWRPPFGILSPLRS